MTAIKPAMWETLGGQSDIRLLSWPIISNGTVIHDDVSINTLKMNEDNQEKQVLNGSM